MECSKKGNPSYYINSFISESYNSTRPSFPAEVYEKILSYMSSGCNEHNNQPECFNTAVDIACGTGLTTVPLAKHFKKVIGCDVSETQIPEAKRHNTCDNIEYHVSAAEDLSVIEDGSVDLLAIAGSFQYTDQKKVIQVVQRKLHTNGVFAIYNYIPPKPEQAEARKAQDEYYQTILAAPTDVDMEMLYTKGGLLKLPFDDVKRIIDIPLSWDLSLSDYITYLKGNALYSHWIKNNPDSDIFNVLTNKLKLALCSEKEEDPMLHLATTVFIVMGRNR